MAERDGAAARVQAAKDRIKNASASLAEARFLLSFTTLTAPIDGILTSRLKQVGERVRGSDFNEDPIVIIATLSSMEMKVEVGEHEVVHLHEGDQAEIEIDAFPDKRFPAQVIEIAKNATVKNAGTEAEVTTFPVRIALTVPGARRPAGHERPGHHLHRDPRPGPHRPLQAVTVRTEKQLAAGKDPKDGGPRPPSPAARPRRRRPASRCRRWSSWSRTARPGSAGWRPGSPARTTSSSSPA